MKEGQCYYRHYPTYRSFHDLFDLFSQPEKFRLFQIAPA